MIDGIKLGVAFNNRLNNAELLKQAQDTYKDDDHLGAIFKNKRTLLQAITEAVGTSGKLSVQEWASIGKALGIYSDTI